MLGGYAMSLKKLSLRWGLPIAGLFYAQSQIVMMPDDLLSCAPDGLALFHSPHNLNGANGLEWRGQWVFV